MKSGLLPSPHPLPNIDNICLFDVSLFYKGLFKQIVVWTPPIRQRPFVIANHRHKSVSSINMPSRILPTTVKMLDYSMEVRGYKGLQSPVGLTLRAQA